MSFYTIIHISVHVDPVIPSGKIPGLFLVSCFHLDSSLIDLRGIWLIQSHLNHLRIESNLLRLASKYSIFEKVSYLKKSVTKSSTLIWYHPQIILDMSYGYIAWIAMEIQNLTFPSKFPILQCILMDSDFNHTNNSLFNFGDHTQICIYN